MTPVRSDDGLGVDGGFWSTLGRQLRHPTGMVGQVTGLAMNVVNRRSVNMAIEALDLKPADDIVELGFGSGYGIARLTSMSRTGKIAGIDQSRAMLDQATRKNRFAIADGRVSLLQGRFDSLPWGSEAFNCALLVNVIYFFNGDGSEVAEVYRVLKPGGILAAYATARSTMENWPFCKPDTHLTFERDELTQLFTLGGFANAHINIQPVELMSGINGYIITAHKPLLTDAGNT